MDKSKFALLKQIRVDNNDLWMELLRIAVESDIERTRGVLNKIRDNDLKISMFMKELAST